MPILCIWKPVTYTMLHCGSPLQKRGLFLFFFLFSRFSRCHREPGSLVLRVSAKMFIPLNSWVRVFCLLSPSLIQRVCGDSNSLTVGSEKGCHGSESRLFAHVQTSRMDEDTDGFSLRWTFLLNQPLCGWRHGNPNYYRLASYWMREDIEL